MNSQKSNLSISSFTKGLKKRSDGVYYPLNKSKSISYPQDGNRFCFEIEEGSWWFNHRNECIVSIIRSFCLPGIFFDIGGGNGFQARKLQDSGFEAVVVEPGKEGAQNAAERGVRHVFCTTLTFINTAEKKIPNAGAFDVLEHIEDDEEMLAQLYEKIGEGGYLFISVPAYQWLWSTSDNHAQHHRRYTTGSLRRKMIRAGFDVKFTTYIFSFLWLPILLFRVLPYKLGKEVESKEEKKNFHKPKSKLVSLMLRAELWLLSRGWGIPIGSSCFVVGQK